VATVSIGWASPGDVSTIWASRTGVSVSGTISELQHGPPSGARIEQALAFGMHSWQPSAVKVGPQ
jgi:hypothetical protein